MTRFQWKAVTAIGLSAGFLAACGNSAAAPTTTTTNVATAACARINDALSNGPDSDADPVGYALAQIAPLHQVAASTSDTALRSAVDGLAQAFQTQFKTDDVGAGVKATVTKALDRVQALCPGSGS